MNKLVLLGLGLGVLALASQSKAATLAPPPPSPLPPEPYMPPVAPPTSVKTMPTDVSISLPAGWRRLSQAEVFPELTNAALDMLKLNDKPGTKYPFELDGEQYYAGIELSNGKRNVSLFVKE